MNNNRNLIEGFKYIYYIHSDTVCNINALSLRILLDLVCNDCKRI